jgi:tetratricopeptide (TPR) repeat protein
MIKRSELSILIYIILVASIVGCAPLVRKISDERVAKAYLQRGREHEHEGDLVEALRQYKLAMTVAVDCRNRVDTKLRSLAQKHYKAGLEFHNNGKYGLAHHQFLIALRLWPDYPEAVDRLTSRKRIKIKSYVVHTIEQGENLSQLAEMYYGDSGKFHIIAKCNNLTDAARVHAGQEIKVPEIEGMEFLVGKGALKGEARETVDSGSWAGEGHALKEQEYGETLEAEHKEEEKQSVDQVAIYREHGVDLFRKGEYQEAIVELDKVLNVYPEDSMALEYSFKSYFQQGVALFEKKDYLAAKDRFESCLLYKTDCDKCYMYIERSENLYNEIHYQKGVECFAREQLVEAIEEWELVRVIDPNYKEVDHLINKAKKILKKVEELKKSQQERE